MNSNKYPNVGEIWVDTSDSELCKIIKMEFGVVYRKFLNNIAGRQGTADHTDVEYFLNGWKRSEKDLVNEILRQYD